MKLKSHEGIVKYFSFDRYSLEEDENDYPVILMKKYETSLAKSTMKRNETNFIKLFNFLLSTLQVLHNNGIIHRDLKPENILIDAEDFIISDFGIASYNPDMFSVQPETKQNERLGNRLFSAPEQEKRGVEPQLTMDIYAFGQILQWFINGDIHRGTGRTPITNSFKNLHKYDIVIERCLSNDPRRRYQSFTEILTELNKPKEVNVYVFLRLFNKILSRNQPITKRGLAIVDDKNEIDELIIDLLKEISEFKRTLYYHTSLGCGDFYLSKIDTNRWKFDNEEYLFSKMWVFHDSRLYNDFILLKYEADNPFEKYKDEPYHNVLLSVYDANNYKYDDYIISDSEHNSGYAKIEGKTFDLSEHRVIETHRQQKSGFIIISTKYSCSMSPKNDSIIKEYFDSVFKNSGINFETIFEFQQELSKHFHEKVILGI